MLNCEVTMNNVDFNKFVKENPNWEKTNSVYTRDDNNYKRIPLCKDEEITNKANETIKLHHEYHSTIDTRSGEIYLDCRKRKIFAKHLFLAIVRPLHTLVKTLWHATLIGPIVNELFKLYKKPTEDDLEILRDEITITSEELDSVDAPSLGEKKAILLEQKKAKLLEQKKTKFWEDKKATFITNNVNSLKDIIRTPFYGTLITITHVAGAILGAISPKTLYKTRYVAGLLERKMLRVDDMRHSDGWSLAPCFSPMNNIALMQDKSRVANNQVRFRRESRAVFNNCWALLPKDKAYISAAAPVSARKG